MKEIKEKRRRGAVIASGGGKKDPSGRERDGV